jgi:hypothetical protein
MTIRCLLCRRGAKGTSRVLASRRVAVFSRRKNTKRVRSETMERYRECLSCGLRWKTREFHVV